MQVDDKMGQLKASNWFNLVKEFQGSGTFCNLKFRYSTQTFGLLSSPFKLSLLLTASLY